MGAVNGARKVVRRGNGSTGGNGDGVLDRVRGEGEVFVFAEWVMDYFGLAIMQIAHTK